jgi:hypothetical protein
MNGGRADEYTHILSISLLFILLPPTSLSSLWSCFSLTHLLLFTCVLPVGLGSHPLGYLLSSLSIIWCTYSASGIFTTILRMDHQRFLVAYPVGLLYGVFALLSVFGVKK